MARSGTSSDVVARWEGGLRATVTVRDFSFVVDEPEDSGGNDGGPMPTEYLLGAMASCYTLAIAWSAKRCDVEVGDLEVTAVGEYDGPRFKAIAIKVRSDLPDEVLEPLLRSADRVCYVSQTLSISPSIEVTRA
ncbi:MAG: OsmC family protein [Marmoricola sp.]